MEKLVETLPAGERVVCVCSTHTGRGAAPSRQVKAELRHLAEREPLSFNRLDPTQYVTHLLSRACLGHCFDYMNYEPSTGQFRIHALPGNRVVLGNWADC